jgi:hypothetical protein
MLGKATNVVRHDSHELKWDSNRIPVDNVARFARSLRRGSVCGLSEKKMPLVFKISSVFCSVFTNITSVASLNM